jgi:hypothetical protein
MIAASFASSGAGCWVAQARHSEGEGPPHVAADWQCWVGPADEKVCIARITWHDSWRSVLIFMAFVACLHPSYTALLGLHEP